MVKAPTITKGKIQNWYEDNDVNTFSRRLKEAARALRLSPHKACHLIADRTDIPWRTAYGHMMAQRMPEKSKLSVYVRAYASALQVTQDFLLGRENPNDFNQVTNSQENPSLQKPPFQRIPVLTPPEKEKSEDARLTAMATLPVPAAFCVGDDTYIWQIPEADFGMIGGGYDFRPGSYVIVEKSPTILPGSIVLCRPLRFDNWTIRLFKSALPHSAAKKFELISPNPLFEAILIKSHKDCQIEGRIRYSINQW